MNKRFKITGLTVGILIGVLAGLLYFAIDVGYFDFIGSIMNEDQWFTFFIGVLATIVNILFISSAYKIGDNESFNKVMYSFGLIYGGYITFIVVSCILGVLTGNILGYLFMEISLTGLLTTFIRI